MGFETFNRTEEKYQAEVERLTSIAVKVSFDARSLFLECLADAWLQADSSEKRILREAWAAIVVKYSLEEEGQ